MNVLSTRLVDGKRRLYATIINVVGLSLPFIMIDAGAPIFIFFWSIPNDYSNINIFLSKDLSPRDTVYKKFVTNKGYLISEKRQIRKHTKAFTKFLNIELLRFEERYKERNIKEPISKGYGE